MKTKLTIGMLYIGVALILPMHLKAGGNESAHGGGSFVCLDTNENVLSALSQDLWEAENFHKPPLTIPERSGSEIEGAFEVIEKLNDVNPKFYLWVRDALADILERREILPLKIPPTGDDDRIVEPFKCLVGLARFLQAAIYTSDKRILYSQYIWDVLAPTHQMAVNVHEAVYKVLRDRYNDSDARRTIQIVGLLFSEGLPSELHQMIPPAKFNPEASLDVRTKIEELWRLFKDEGKVVDRQVLRSQLSRPGEDIYFLGLYLGSHRPTPQGSWYVFDVHNPTLYPLKEKNTLVPCRFAYDLRGHGFINNWRCARAEHNPLYFDEFFARYEDFHRYRGSNKHALSIIEQHYTIQVNPGDIIQVYRSRVSWMRQTEEGDFIMTVFSVSYKNENAELLELRFFSNE